MERTKIINTYNQKIKKKMNNLHLSINRDANNYRMIFKCKRICTYSQNVQFFSFYYDNKFL